MPSILIAYDGSSAAQRALERAAALAGGGGVTVVSVVPVAQGGGRGGGIDPASAGVDGHRKLLDEAVERLRGLGASAQAIEAVGHPAESIVEAARTGGHDLIVVGASGHGGIGRALLGSVTDSVVRHAACDVLVVR